MAHGSKGAVGREEAPVPFRTPRLTVREATEDDEAFIVSLWSDPRVTRFVGFPDGIPSAKDDVLPRIRQRGGLPSLLIAEEAVSGRPIGQCLLGAPDAEGVSEPDIKLSPAFWGRGYGSELWAALIERLFLFSTCRAVRGTPNVANVASIRMQEKAGMRRVGQGVCEFPDSMKPFTAPVPHYVYETTRDVWAERRERDG